MAEEKKVVSKKDQQTIEALNESGSEVTTVGNGVDPGWGRVSNGIIWCVGRTTCNC